MLKKGNVLIYEKLIITKLHSIILLVFSFLSLIYKKKVSCKQYKNFEKKEVLKKWNHYIKKGNLSY